MADIPNRPFLALRAAMRRILPGASAAVLAIAFAGCTDDPVAETLRIEFFPRAADAPEAVFDVVYTPPDTNGYVKLEAEVAINRHQVPEDNAHIERRLNDRTEALINGYDVWHLRFDRLYEPLANGAESRWATGDLRSYRRWALVGDPDSALKEFFANTPMRPSLSVRDNELRLPDERRPPQTVHLEFVFDGGTLATAGESETVERGLRGFAADVASYQRRLAALWRYLDENPDRRFACLVALLAGEVPESQFVVPPRELAPGASSPEAAERTPAEPVLRELEIDLIKRVEDASEPLIEFFEVPEDDAFTLQELSRRVFDPFPAAITVAPDGRVVEAVGFAEAEDGWTIPSLDLWNAYRALDGRFVSPDPVLFLFDAEGSLPDTEDDDFGCDDQDDACKNRQLVLAFLEQGDFVSRPGSSNLIKQALEVELRPLDVYRLVWLRAGNAGDPGEADGPADEARIQR